MEVEVEHKDRMVVDMGQEEEDRLEGEEEGEEEVVGVVVVGVEHQGPEEIDTRFGGADQLHKNYGQRQL